MTKIIRKILSIIVIIMGLLFLGLQLFVTFGSTSYGKHTYPLNLWVYSLAIGLTLIGVFLWLGVFEKPNLVSPEIAHKSKVNGSLLKYFIILFLISLIALVLYLFYSLGQAYHYK